MYGFTLLLGIKSVLTALSGLPVFLAPKKVVDPLGFPKLTAGHIHMTKMWGLWMCVFQAPLEAGMAFYVEGTARNLFGLVEGAFEIALLLEVCFDRRTKNAAKYSSPIEVTYLITVLLFFGVLFFAPDPVDDAGEYAKALVGTSVIVAVALILQVIGLARGVDYGKDEDDKAQVLETPRDPFPSDQAFFMAA
jgi:hypothetical protein